ncbi:hypothetical protein RUND412_002646 [Rhizina undulata]
MPEGAIAPHMLSFAELMDSIRKDGLVPMVEISQEKKASLLRIPTESEQELLIRVLSYLNVKDLKTCALVCKRFGELSVDDLLWKSHVGLPLVRPLPYPGFYHLYKYLHPYLWLHRRLWIGDEGTLVASKYVPGNGTMGFYEVIPFPEFEKLPEPELPKTTEFPGQNIPIYTQNVDTRVKKPPMLTLSTASFKRGLESYGNYMGNFYSGFYSMQRVIVVRDDQQRGTHRTYWRSWPPGHIPAEYRILTTEEYLRDPGFYETWARGLGTGNVVLSKSFLRLKKYYGTNRFSSEDKLRLDDFDIEHIILPLLTTWHVETFFNIGPEHLNPTNEYPMRGLWAHYNLRGKGEFVLIVQEKRDCIQAISVSGNGFHTNGEVVFKIPSMGNIIRHSTEPLWPGVMVVPAQLSIRRPRFGFLGVVEEAVYVDTEAHLVNNDQIALLFNRIEGMNSSPGLRLFRRVNVDRIFE